MGIQLSGVPSGGALAPHLFLRCACELEGPPVYKADQDLYYLYWVSSSGQSKQNGSRHPSGALLLLPEAGHWVIAPRCDVLPGSFECLAFAEGTAAMPHQLDLSDERCWQVAFKAPIIDGRKEPPDFRPCSTLRLMAQEWADSYSEGRESMTGFQSD